MIGVKKNCFIMMDVINWFHTLVNLYRKLHCKSMEKVNNVGIQVTLLTWVCHCIWRIKLFIEKWETHKTCHYHPQMCYIINNHHLKRHRVLTLTPCNLWRIYANDCKALKSTIIRFAKIQTKTTNMAINILFCWFMR